MKPAHLITFILSKGLLCLMLGMPIIAIPKELLWADDLFYLYIVMMSIIFLK